MSLFDQPKWPIWKVLAWVLTRDQEFTERSSPQDFAPGRADEEYVSRDEVTQAWCRLHEALVSGSVELLPIAHTRDPNQPSPHTDNARQISTNVAHSLTWDWLTANVEASSLDVLRYFPPGSDAIAQRVDLTQPEIRPDGAGYMDLTYAACWIATEGGKVSFFYREKEVWRSAFDKLLPAVASSEIEVIGRQIGGLPAPLVGTLFASITVEYPYHDEVRLNLMWGEKPYVRCWGGWDNEREHGVDELWVGDGDFPAYSYLQVRKEHVSKLWPFESNQAQYMTGKPGRPSPMALVEQELRSRLDQNITESTITDEARYLAGWLKQHHPGAPPLKPKTIKNRMASVYRQGRARN
jgi:hypothetical protein